MNRILAIDYGEKKIGLALSDPLKIIAKPFRTIENLSIENLLIDLERIICEKNVNEIVVGLPITLKNSFSKQTKVVEKFIEILKDKLKIKIIVVDERLSSIEAKKSLILQNIKTGHNKREVDMTAAAIFLQSYLNNIVVTK